MKTSGCEGMTTRGGEWNVVKISCNLKQGMMGNASTTSHPSSANVSSKQHNEALTQAAARASTVRVADWRPLM